MNCQNWENEYSRQTADVRIGAQIRFPQVFIAHRYIEMRVYRYYGAYRHRDE